MAAVLATRASPRSPRKANDASEDPLRSGHKLQPSTPDIDVVSTSVDDSPRKSRRNIFEVPTNVDNKPNTPTKLRSARLNAKVVVAESRSATMRAVASIKNEVKEESGMDESAHTATAAPPQQSAIKWERRKSAQASGPTVPARRGKSAVKAEPIDASVADAPQTTSTAGTVGSKVVRGVRPRSQCSLGAPDSGRDTPAKKTSRQTPGKSTPKRVARAPGAAKGSTKQTTITEHFPARKSGRQCQSKVEQDRLKHIQISLIKGKDSNNLEIFDTAEKGKGVRASASFGKGDYVCEYSGDLVTKQEAERREKEYARDPSIGCYMFYFSHRGTTYCVDATFAPRLGRLINHSRTCANLAPRIVTTNDANAADSTQTKKERTPSGVKDEGLSVNDSDAVPRIGDGRPHIILVAGRDIRAGEELAYDYGDRSKESLLSHPWLAK